MILGFATLQLALAGAASVIAGAGAAGRAAGAAFASGAQSAISSVTSTVGSALSSVWSKVSAVFGRIRTLVVSLGRSIAANAGSIGAMGAAVGALAGRWGAATAGALAHVFSITRLSAAYLRLAAAMRAAPGLLSRMRGAFTGLGASLASLPGRMRALGSSTGQSIRSFFRMRQAVSSVAGAFQGPNGLWYTMRNGARALLLQRHQVTQNLTTWGRFVTAIGQGSSSITDSFLRMGTSQAGVITAGVVALAPLIGAALGAAITAAVGLGVAAAGIAIAAKQSDRVQAAFRDAFQPMWADLREDATVAFEGPLIASAARFKQVWSTVGDDVGRALQKAATFVKPLTEGISQFIENAIGGGGFNKLLDAAGPVISALSRQVAILGDAFNIFFEEIGSAGPGLTKGLTAAFYVLSGAIVIIGGSINYLAHTFDFATTAAQFLTQAVSSSGAAAGAALPLWRYAAETIRLFNSEAGKTHSIVPLAGSAAALAAEGFYGAAAAAEKARRALSDLTDKISGLVNAQLGADQAALAFQRALDSVTQSVKDNGKNIDITTAAGQANIDMVLQAVSAAQQKRDADLKLAGGEKASESAIRAANAAFQAQIAQLEATLRKAGLTQQQIDALLGKYKELANAPNISKTITTTVKTVFVEVGQPMKVKTPGNQVAYASGTDYARAGVALVGENGPELVRFRGGEQVIPADETARMMADSKDLAKGSALDMKGLNGSRGAVAVLAPPAVHVYIGNEEIKDYMVKVADDRADARQARTAHRLLGR